MRLSHLVLCIAVVALCLGAVPAVSANPTYPHNAAPVGAMLSVDGHQGMLMIVEGEGVPFDVFNSNGDAISSGVVPSHSFQLPVQGLGEVDAPGAAATLVIGGETLSLDDDHWAWG